MSKRAIRIPAPLPRLFPSIRSLGPRVLLLSTGCAVLLILGSGSYLLSRTVLAPTYQATSPSSSQKAAAKQNSKVLGASTDSSSTQGANSTATTTPAPSTPTPTTPPASPTQASVATPRTQAAAIKPSFDIVVNTSQISQGLTGIITVPFSVVRHGNVPDPIAPTTVTVYSGGNLTSLITLKSESMQGPDTGTITLLPIGLFPRDIVVQLAAKSGTLTSGTTFSYHINL